MPSLTAEPDEIDSKAGAALAERLAAAGDIGAPQPDPECGMVQRLTRDLQSDAETGAALDRLPRPALSVSGAVLIWNGDWIDAGLIGGPAVREPIRAGVVRSLGGAPPDCLQRYVVGPRFVLLDSPRGQRVLVIGSGAWRWADLIAPPAPGARHSDNQIFFHDLILASDREVASYPGELAGCADGRIRLHVQEGAQWPDGTGLV